MKNDFEVNGSSSSLDCEEAMIELLWDYGEYEQKIVSHQNNIINRLRDYYYLHYTGMKYEEWLAR